MYDLSNAYFTDPVLIDTWWNVNDKCFIYSIDDYIGFNRYMVECECTSFFMIRLLPHLVLIDTWWNVNTVPSHPVTLPIRVLIDTWWNVNKGQAGIIPA